VVVILVEGRRKPWLNVGVESGIVTRCCRLEGVAIEVPRVVARMHARAGCRWHVGCVARLISVWSWVWCWHGHHWLGVVLQD